MLQSSTIQFVKDLKNNNNKAWFEENRSRYENAKTDFESFIEIILKKFSVIEPDIGNLKAKDCTFRINRDVRFAKDKSPYKTNMGAYICRGGKNSIYAGYYFHFQPGESITGGGLWMPLPGELKKLRQEIDYNFDDFKKIVSSKKFISVFGGFDRSESMSLVNIPKGYEKDHPAAEYLKLKSLVAIHQITDAELVSKNLTGIVMNAFKTLQPLVKFINNSLD